MYSLEQPGSTDGFFFVPDLRVAVLSWPHGGRRSLPGVACEDVRDCYGQIWMR